jgi:hypothetical protein
MNRTKIAISVLLLLLFAQAIAQRDPLRWPFSATSIWNMPIHTNAKYIPANLPAPSQAGLTADEDIIILDYKAPITIFKTSMADWNRDKNRCIPEDDTLLSAPLPQNFIFNQENWLGKTPNAGIAIIMPDGRTIKNTQPFARCEAGKPATSHYNYPDSDLFGDGIDGAHGGSGMSVLGGTIRLGELVPNGIIRHAIKINIDRHYLCYNDSMPGYRWPARKADGYAKEGYSGKNPELCMGTLLAIPPCININEIGLKTEPAKILAKAFQDYGAYIVDDPYWDVVAIPVEHSPQGRVTDEFKEKWGFAFEIDTASDWGQDIAIIVTRLQIVSGNDSNNIGGGPTFDFKNRRTQMAEKLIEP